MYKPSIINQDNVVLGGNMRLKAYKELGIDEIWVSPVVTKDENEMWEYALSDNDHVGITNMDIIINNMPQLDIDWSKYSVDTKPSENIQDLIDSLTPTEEDNVPEVSDEPAISKYGEVYQLGRHRLMCGDATKIEDVEKLMDGQKAQLIMSDPPYNVDYTGGSTNEEKREDSYKDKWTDEQYTEFLRLVWSNSFVVSDNETALMIWFASAKMKSVIDGFEQAGWTARTMIVWNKLKAHYGALGAQYKHKFEPLWYCHKKGQSPRWYGETNETTVWDYDQPSINDLHPTMKPVGLYVRAIKNHTKEADNVYENFGGSGTTLIASEQTNRTCYMMELDPKYCDVIRKRYENFIENGKGK